MTDGNVNAYFVSVNAVKPRATFSTLKIAAALDLLAYPVTSIAGLTAGLAMYGRAFVAGATRGGAIAHKKYLMDTGIVFPTRLTVDHQGEAKIEYSVIPVSSDGTTAPVVPSESASLPTADADDERFTLGEVTLGNVAFTHIKSLEINFGITEKVESADSDIYDTFAAIQESNPIITLRGIDYDWFKTSGAVAITGLAGTQANTSIVLRKRAASGTFVAAATAEHILFNAAGLITIGQAHRSSNNQTAEIDLRMECIHDGTNAPLVIDTTHAYGV